MEISKLQKKTEYYLDNIPFIIMACITLHNLCTHQRDTCIARCRLQLNELNLIRNGNAPAEDGNTTREAIAKMQLFMRYQRGKKCNSMILLMPKTENLNFNGNFNFKGTQLSTKLVTWSAQPQHLRDRLTKNGTTFYYCLREVTYIFITLWLLMASFLFCFKWTDQWVSIH